MKMANGSKTKRNNCKSTRWSGRTLQKKNSQVNMTSKTRQKLPKLKGNKNPKRIIKTIDKVIAETSQDDMDLATINQKQYTAAALVITKKILPPKPQVMKINTGKPLTWQHNTIQ